MIVVVTVVEASGVVTVFVDVMVVVTVVLLTGVVVVTVVVVLAVAVVVVGIRLLTTPTHVTAAGNDGGGLLLTFGHSGCCLAARIASRDPAFGERDSSTERFLAAEFGNVLITGEKPAGVGTVFVPCVVVVVVVEAVTVLVIVCVGILITEVVVVVTLEVKVSCEIWDQHLSLNQTTATSNCVDFGMFEHRTGML